MKKTQRGKEPKVVYQDSKAAPFLPSLPNQWKCEKRKVLSSKNKLVISLWACNWTHKPTQAPPNESTGLIFTLHNNHNILGAYHVRVIIWADSWSNIRNMAIRDYLVFQTLLPKCRVSFFGKQHCACTIFQEATKVLQSHEFTCQLQEANLHWNYYSQVWNLTAMG